MEQKEFKFKQIDTEEFEELKYLQISKNELVYTERTIDEYDKLKQFINGRGNIIDLGSGIGRSSIYLNHMMNTNPKFHMCDYTGVDFDKVKSCGTHENADKIPYNDLDLTKEFCELNGLSNIEIIDLDTERLSKLRSMDILYSFHCVGYHWDIKESFDKYNFDKIMKKDSILIFGIRRVKNPFKKYKSLGNFKLIETIKGDYLEDFLIYKKL